MIDALTGGGEFTNRARRRAILSLWIKGQTVEHIAELTGYKIPNVIETIENYENAVKNNQPKIDAFLKRLAELQSPPQ